MSWDEFINTSAMSYDLWPRKFGRRVLLYVILGTFSQMLEFSGSHCSEIPSQTHIAFISSEICCFNCERILFKKRTCLSIVCFLSGTVNLKLETWENRLPIFPLTSVSSCTTWPSVVTAKIQCGYYIMFCRNIIMHCLSIWSDGNQRSLETHPELTSCHQFDSLPNKFSTVTSHIGHVLHLEMLQTGSRANTLRQRDVWMINCIPLEHCQACKKACDIKCTRNF